MTTDSTERPAATPTVERPRKTGPASLYRPKDRKPQSVTLTRFAKRVLEAASRRTGQSKSDVLERLLREYGATVVFDTSHGGEDDE